MRYLAVGLILISLLGLLAITGILDLNREVSLGGVNYYDLRVENGKQQLLADFIWRWPPRVSADVNVSLLGTERRYNRFLYIRFEDSEEYLTFEMIFRFPPYCWETTDDCYS